MSTFSRAQEWLGLDSGQRLSGFQLNSRGPRLPVCDICGALVAFEGQVRHIAWHASDFA